MKVFLFLAFVSPFVGAWFSGNQATGKRVAVLISSYGLLNPDLSYDLEELAQAYLVLHDHGIALDIISPAGGAVPVKANKDTLSYIQRFKNHTPALRQLGATIAAKDADPGKYDGIFIVGGGGAMMDLPSDPGTQKLLTELVKAGRPIAAVCHGPAALTDIKMPDGGFFVAGKQICSFTNVEEKAFSSEMLDRFPFFFFYRMRQRNAIYVSNAPMLPYVAVDGNLITAQNPGSVARAGEALVSKLGLTLRPRTLFKDEAAMALLARARVSGSYQIDLALNSQADAYDHQYLALYAFYSYRLAQTVADKRTELGIMAAVSRHVAHPMLLDALVRAQYEQGFGKKAANSLDRLERDFPEHAALAELKKLVGAD